MPSLDGGTSSAGEIADRVTRSVAPKVRRKIEEDTLSITSMFSNRIAGALVAGVAALAIGWGSAASAQDTQDQYHSSVRIPLTATGGIPVSNVGTNCNSSDTVTLSSENGLHVIAMTRRNIVIVFLHAHGDGSLGRYRAIGADNANLGGNTIPTDGTLAATAQFNLFSLSDRCTPQAVPVKLNLVFSGSVLQSSSTACVTGTSGC
jgi:hypothetical protein